METTTQKSTVNPYEGLAQGELVDALQVLVEQKSAQELRPELEAIKIAFYKEGRAQIEAQREAFVVNGGDPAEFQPEENPLETKFKELLVRYRQMRDAALTAAQVSKEEAYKKKLQVIEELKELVGSSETLGNTFNAFRELQQRWKEAGSVAQEKVKDLWDTYHHHVENFYNYIKIDKELRDLDLKKNLEIKTKLAQEAEKLAEEMLAAKASPVQGFHALQKLHEQWRETGPVALEFKDALWERFRAASTAINKRHQDHFEGIKVQQQDNLLLKLELCERVEKVAGDIASYTTKKAWDEASARVIEAQGVWKTIGFAPKKDNTKVYERLRKACDLFFEAKRTFFQAAKSGEDANLKAKLSLCEQAEALQESEDWKATTEALIGLQKQWKETGPVARRHADKVWNRFRTACDAFFERKTKHFGQRDAARDAKRAADMQHFKERVQGAGGQKGLSYERTRLQGRVRQIEADIQVLENNIGFFSKSKNTQGLVREVENKIAKAKRELAEVQEKIKLIDTAQ